MLPEYICTHIYTYVSMHIVADVLIPFKKYGWGSDVSIPKAVLNLK